MKRSLMGAVMAMVLSVPLLSCGPNGFWNGLKEKIRNGQTTVFVHELTGYDWDMVCVLPAYGLDIGGRGARVQKYIPYNLGEFEDKIPHLNGDGQWAFAFVKDDKVVAIEKKGRSFYLDTKHDHMGRNCISESNARFNKVKNYRNSEEYVILTDKQNWNEK